MGSEGSYQQILFGFSISLTNLASAQGILNRRYFCHLCREGLPAEPEDDVPHGVHDTAGHPATLLLLLLGQTWNILNINQ